MEAEAQDILQAKQGTWQQVTQRHEQGWSGDGQESGSAQTPGRQRRWAETHPLSEMHPSKDTHARVLKTHMHAYRRHTCTCTKDTNASVQARGQAER